MLTLNDGRSELWQWDTGRTLDVDADCSQVHFSNKVFGRSIDVDVIEGVAVIPDILLQTDKELTAWAFVGTAENGYTKISKIFKVNKRNKPADYVFTPVEQTTLAEVVERLENIESTQDPDAIKNAIEDYFADNPIQIDETDPTVPDWAKQPEKPEYTAAEVGAMPADTPIPDAYTLPVATTETLGGVKPVAATDDMTQPVGVDAAGALFTAPGAGGGGRWNQLLDLTLEEEAQILVLNEDSDGNAISCEEMFIALFIPETFAGSNYYIGAFYPEATAGQVVIPYTSGQRYYTTVHTTTIGGIVAVSKSGSAHSVPVYGVSSFALTPGGDTIGSDRVFIHPESLTGVRFTGDYQKRSGFPAGTKVILYGR